jgi:transcriptional regulator with XRE-family HTH domain
VDNTGERRSWRKGRKRVGPDRERPYSELGEFLAELRQSTGLSQHELAEKSLLTKHPFDRTYVARIENGETADTAAKFLTYIALLQAHPETVVEIVESASRYDAVDEDLPLPEYYANAKRESQSGSYGQAVAWVLAGLSKAREVKDPEWEVQLRIAAAIIFKNQNSFSIARRFAEDVLNSESASSEHRVRAAILLAGICIELGQPHSASGMIRTIDGAAIKNDPELLGSYLFESACVSAALGDTDAATLEFRRSAELYGLNQNHERLARIKYRLARIALETHDPDGAHLLASESIGIARRGSFEQIVGMALVVLGRASSLRGELVEAREWLLKAESQAKRLGDTLLQLEARAHLMGIAHKTGDGILKRHTLKLVELGLRSQRVPNALRQQIDDLISRTREGNS